VSILEKYRQSLIFNANLKIDGVSTNNVRRPLEQRQITFATTKGIVAIKINLFIVILLSTCTIFPKKREGRLRLGRKNKRACFVLLSACTIFVFYYFSI